jgi:hypothetical protein
MFLIQSMVQESCCRLNLSVADGKNKEVTLTNSNE